MNRAELKARARQSMSWAKPSPVWVTLVYMLLPLLLSLVSGVSTVINNVMYGESLSGLPMRTVWLLILTVAIGLLYAIIEAGYLRYCLDVSRNRPASFGTLFEFINRPLRFIGLSLLMSLAMVAAVIPAVLAMGILSYFSMALGVLAYIALLVLAIYVSLGFSQAMLVAVDEPDRGVVDCMKDSWELMAGRRGEYFVLNLSFILWGFACMLFFPTFWVTPYMSVTKANYYSLIAGKLPRENRPPSDGYGPEASSWQSSGGWPPQDDGGKTDLYDEPRDDDWKN